ncbi:MAG: hypothetical protein GEV11_24545 [Streptosporangiales bacterium]|nr:hypothetical protein [Streptosporangiales bacterium]
MRPPPIRAALTAVCAALLLTGCWAPMPPRADYPTPKVTPPAGMTAVEWAWFGFAMPSEWQLRTGSGSTNHWVDSTGATRASADITTILECPSKTRPEPLQTGITNRASISGTAPLRVPGAAGGFRYELTGDPEGPRSELHAWLPNCEKQLWITVFDESPTVDRIAETIVAQQD